MSPLKDGHRRRHLYHWPSLVVSSQCKQRISFCTLARLCRPGCLCSGHGQPVIIQLVLGFYSKSGNFFLIYLNLIVFANWHGTHIILLFQFFRQWGRHQLPANVRWGLEMPLTALASGRRYISIELHRWVPEKWRNHTFRLGLERKQNNRFFHLFSLCAQILISQPCRTRIYALF